MKGSAFILVSGLFMMEAHANGANVINATANCNENFCRFDVTVAHDDNGWDHYADGIEILNTEKDTMLGFRKLLHPHVGQASFTRSVSVLFEQVPDKVIIRAHDSQHGHAGNSFTLELK